MTATLTRTRQSIGTQLREAFNDLLANGAIADWTFTTATDGRCGYFVKLVGDKHFTFYTPGEAMERVNESGYNVYFGKA